MTELTLTRDDFEAARVRVAPHTYHTPMLTSRSLSEASQSEVRLDTDGNVDTLVTEGVLPGHISREERGSSGFGYDPVFVVSRMNKTLAELSPEEKNAISHRRQLLAAP